MLNSRFTGQALGLILVVSIFLVSYFVVGQPTKSTPQVDEDVYWLCTDLPEFAVPGTTVSVHTPKDGETMNAACRDMDKDFFRAMEKVAGGWVRDGDSQEKNTLGFMRWLDLDLPHDLAYRIKSTAFMPNLVLITIIPANQPAVE